MTVLTVPDDGTALGGEVDTDLVGAAGLQVQLYELIVDSSLPKGTI